MLTTELNPEQSCVWARRERPNTSLEIKPDARLLVQGAQTIGGSAVVLDSGVVVIWGFCRSFRANSGFMETDAVCLHLYDPAKRHCSTFYQVNTPRCSSPAAQPLMKVCLLVVRALRARTWSACQGSSGIDLLPDYA